MGFLFGVQVLDTGLGMRFGVQVWIQVRDQPRSQGFSVRTRRDTRKPWSGPVNFAF